MHCKREFCRENEGGFLQLYKPLTVINAFKSSGIYPIDSFVVTRDMLKPSLSYIIDASDCEKDTENVKQSREEQRLAECAFKVFESSLNTSYRQRYSQRIQEGYNEEGVSPCFDVYKKPHNKANPSNDKEDGRNASTSELLAHVAVQQPIL